MARLAMALALVLAVAALAVPSGAGAAHRHGTFLLHLPSAGHVTVATIEVKTRKLPAGTRAQRNLKLKLLDTRRLPPSVRILTAGRRIAAKRAYRYELLVIGINKAGVASAADDHFKLEDAFMAWIAGAVRSHKCGTCGDQMPAG